MNLSTIENAKWESTTVAEFSIEHRRVTSYDSARTATGVNPAKLAMFYVSEKIVGSIVFFDHLYIDGREIYIPTFNKRFSSLDGMTARLETHSFLEEKAKKILSVDEIISVYTDAYPTCPVFFIEQNINNTSMSFPEITESVANVRVDVNTVQHSLF